MFKSLILIALLCVPVLSQDYWNDEEFTVEFTALRKNFDFAVPVGDQFRIQRENDSLGGRFGYRHWIGRKNGRGDVGIGIEGGGNFSNIDSATVDSGNVTLGYAHVNLALQRNKPGVKFRPGIKALAGISRERFKLSVVTDPNTGAINGLSSGTNAWDYG